MVQLGPMKNKYQKKQKFDFKSIQSSAAKLRSPPMVPSVGAVQWQHPIGCSRSGKEKALPKAQNILVHTSQIRVNCLEFETTYTNEGLSVPNRGHSTPWVSTKSATRKYRRFIQSHLNRKNSGTGRICPHHQPNYLLAR
ncbi:expressed unknown protein [Seminavis robusta]|uniref:Uncharacterized protein n=1 Tax=Seminavis robusta TaxID=568900 RepID=A0A9N8DGG7_9STRA|nr:expressed unknown protein [Seminavis robusta]|eukprot:Sro79_g042701.1  (139) ;mRNA; f:50169-50585